ncbi:MAG: hypothetical protein GX202_04950 [Firmicutes bacterium]|nr:hypothetical protein [Bacillota bacterium]
MSIRIASILRQTDFNLTRFLHYTFEGKLRTATLLLYLASRQAFPHWDQQELYKDCYAKTVFIYKAFF